MPLTRYEVKNEYGLADPELYRSADRDDPEALLEGVAMAGLVGVLRQLGDLAEFAAEIFHDLHEEVLSTAARGHGLMVRVQQLEAEVPSIEKALLSQTNLLSFFSNTGTEWHSNMRSEQNLIAQGDLPRFIMDSYEECRGPPRLFLLDKFDVGGAGACLKRYTDPSFLKVEAATNGVATVQTQRERKTRKAKKRGSRWRNVDTPEVVPTSHTKLHQLLLEERIENSYTDPARLIKLKKRQFNGSAIDSKSGKSYMEKFVETPSPEQKEVCQTSITLPHLTYISANTCDSDLRVLEIRTVSPAKSSSGKGSVCSSFNSHEVVSKPLENGFTEEMADRELVQVSLRTPHDREFEISSIQNETEAEKLLTVSAEDKTVGSVNGYDSDGVTSDVDNYMDALAIIESELETDNEYRPKNNLPVLNLKRHGTDSDSKDEHLELQAQLSESQSTGNFSRSDDSIKNGRSSFSYPDTPSSLVEKTTSDFDTFAKVSPSETRGAETVYVPSNQLAVMTESLGTKSGDPVMSDDACIQEDKLCSIDLSPQPFYLDPRERLPMVSPAEPNDIYEIEDKETNVVDLGIVVSEVSSQTSNDFKKTSQSYPLNELDNGELSNISEDSARESRVCAVNEVFETQYMDSDSYQSLVGNEIYFTTIASTEVHSLAEVECQSRALVLSDGLPASIPHYTDVNKAEDLDTEIDSVVTAVGVVEDLPDNMITAQNCVSEELRFRVDSPESNSLVEQQLSEFVECAPHIEPVSDYAGVTYFTGKSNLDEISGTMNEKEITQCTSSVDEVKENGFSQLVESSILNDPGEESRTSFDDVVPEAVKLEDLEVPFAITFNAIDVDNNLISTDKVCSPSGHITSLQEPVYGFVDHSKKEMEWNEVGSPECLIGLEKGVAACGLEVASEDLGMNPSNLGSSDLPSSETVCVQDLSATEQNENSVTINDVTASSTHLELSNMESETKSSCQNHPFNNSVDDMSSSTFHTRELSEGSLKLQTDHVEAKSLKMNNSGYHLDTPLDNLESQAGQLDEECLPTDEVHINSLNRSIEKIELLYSVVEGSCQQRESLEYINQEMQSDASLESCHGDLVSQHSTSEISAQSGGLEVENTKQSLTPLKSTLPSFMLLPKAGQLDSREMPPLPPLPPVQWRMGRFQFASEVSQKDLLKVNPDLFPPKQLTIDDIAQVESHTSQSQMEQPQNPLLPLEALVNEKSQQGPEHLLGNLAQPITHSLQLPTMVDANIQYNHLTSEETLSSNPFLTVPATCNGRPGGTNLSLEGEMAQSSSSSLSPIPSTEYRSPGDDQVVSQEVIHPLNRVALEKGLDATEHRQSLPKSGLEQGNLPNTSVSPSTMVDQSQLLWIPEGEGSWVSSSYAMMPECEVGKPNGNPINKLPRPRNPLIEAVAAHGKSKLRKVTERPRPEIEPKLDERDSLLEQIRTKSFNLKPAAVTRPSVQGPKTNLRVAAILEKANAIRQAWVGSDEDDNEDSWSDS